MAAQKGRSVLTYIGDGASPATFTVIGGAQETTSTEAVEPVDITTKTNAPFRTLLADAGLYTLDISLNGIFEDDAGLVLVEDVFRARGIEEFQIVYGNGDLIQGNFQPTQLEYGGPHLAAQTFTLTLLSSGVFTFSRA